MTFFVLFCGFSSPDFLCLYFQTEIIFNNWTNSFLVDIAGKNLNYQHYENFSFIEIYFALLIGFFLALFTLIYF